MNIYLIICALVVGVLMGLCIAKIRYFIKLFKFENKMIRFEMKNAQSHMEYCELREKLRCRKLCLIPFVNEKNVKRVHDFIYNKNKNQEQKDNLFKLLLPSALGMVVCTICMCGMTWAWYSASVKTKPQTMNAAYYEIVVTSISEKDGGAEVVKSDGGYSLTQGSAYVIKITANGTVKSGGYCLIENKAENIKQYTQTIDPSNSISFEYAPSASGKYTFTGMWGKIPTTVNENDIIKNGATVNVTRKTKEPSKEETSGELMGAEVNLSSALVTEEKNEPKVEEKPKVEEEEKVEEPIELPKSDPVDENDTQSSDSNPIEDSEQPKEDEMISNEGQTLQGLEASNETENNE